MAGLIVDEDLDFIDFRDRLGVMRKTYGCSILGRSEFLFYWGQAVEIIEKAEVGSLSALYLEHERFRHCCDQCLTLNKIDPDWLDHGGLLLRSLLFQRDKEHLGALVSLNSLSFEGEEPKDSGNDGSLESNVGAAFLASLNSFKSAMDALEHPRGKLALQILKARDKAMKEAEQEAKDKADGKNTGFKKWAKEMREKGGVKVNTETGEVDR